MSEGMTPIGLDAEGNIVDGEGRIIFTPSTPTQFTVGNNTLVLDVNGFHFSTGDGTVLEVDNDGSLTLTDATSGQTLFTIDSAGNMHGVTGKALTFDL